MQNSHIKISKSYMYILVCSLNKMMIRHLNEKFKNEIHPDIMKDHPKIIFALLNEVSRSRAYTPLSLSFSLFL